MNKEKGRQSTQNRESSAKFDICVLGLGYIGLPTTSIFAARNKRVLGVDVVQSVVDTINNGEIHFEEPDLDILVRAGVQSGQLTAAVKPAKADTYIIAVPTPFNVDVVNGRKIPDLSYVEQATRSIASVVEEGNLIILESTSPVGTTEKMRDWLVDELQTKNPALKTEKLLFTHCPERILPGQMLKELVSNDRIVGGLTEEASVKAKGLYETFCTADIYLTDARTAEMSKLTENASRDVNIAFANELSMICEELNIDVWELIELANKHPRVNILQPGPGVGGHCIAVDPYFIIDAAPETSRLMKTAREVNESKPTFVFNQIKAKAERFKRPVVACFGLAFKPNVDDLRESPALGIVEALSNESDYEVLAVEPYIQDLPKKLMGKVQLVTQEEALKRADLVVMLVDHQVFKRIPIRLIQDKVLVDTRGVFR